jgi:hypothetical protein
MYIDDVSVSQMKMTFQEIRIIATGPCIANQLRDVITICRRSLYIAAHVWKIYDFKIEVESLYSDTKILSKYSMFALCFFPVLKVCYIAKLLLDIEI